MLLLERDRHGVTLTPAGYAFLQEARDVIARADRSAAIAREVADGRSGRIRLTCGPASCDAALTRVLRLFANDNPGLAVELHVASDVTSIQALTAERVDAALVHDLPLGEARADGFMQIPFARDELAIAVAANHALVSSEPVTRSDLRGSRLVASAGSAYPALHRIVRDFCAGFGEETHLTQYVEDPLALLALTGAGFGVAVVPARWQRLAPDTVRFRSIEPPNPAVTLGVYVRGDARNAALNVFLPYLESGAGFL